MRRLLTGVALLVVVTAGVLAAQEAPLARLQGADFDGGAKHLYGEVHHGMASTNYVYARPTDVHRMQAEIEVAAIPGRPMSLYLRGRDDDAEAACPIEIKLNGTSLHEGPSGHARDAFTWKAYAIPEGALRRGVNTIAIVNTAAQGVTGMPPWFMLAECAVAAADFDSAAPPPIEDDFRVALPEAVRPLPEPLPEGQAPGFPLRGTKGWLWRAEQYLAEVPVLAEHEMNFLMICYGSMCDIEHYAWGHSDCNRWWEPLPDEKRAAYEGVLRACQEHGVELCLSMNPNLTSKRILDYDSETDLDALWQHYAWMQALGMKWFCISLDDIRKGIDAAGQARLVNAMFERLRANDAQARLIFCPTRYWGDGTEAGSRAYLETLAAQMDAKIYLFWTGDAVVTPRITQAAAASYKAVAQHRLIIWDNYPVNDAHPTLHLGPVTGRDADLSEVCDGYMSNPLHSENEVNRIPLLTCADYAFNPWAYDPARAIGQAIVHVAENDAQRAVLKDLVELYPGMLVYAKGTAWNSVVSHFTELLATPHLGHLAALYLRHVEDVLARIEAAFPGRFGGAKATVRQNLAEMHEAYSAKYGE